MSPLEIKAVRESLGLTQAQFGELLGVHPITVSKWERGVLAPNQHQSQLIASFANAQANEPNIGAAVVGVLAAAGIAAGLFLLLKAAFEDDA